MAVVEELYTPEQLAQMHDSLWQCVLQFANVSAAQERNRIARDLHDSVGHALTALNFQLQTAMKLCKPDPNQAQEFLTEAHKWVTIATKEVRESVKALRNDAVETRSLETLVQSLVDDFESTTGVLPEVYIDLPVELPSHLVAPIYRITQEALNNIRKYARATTVQIHICTTVTGAYLIVRDNGRGFDLENVSGGYGLRGMQERVAVLQGSLQIDSQPGNGCCISVGIPIRISKISGELTQKISSQEIETPALLSHTESQQNNTQNFLQQDIKEDAHYPVVEIGEWQFFDLHEYV
ncbi:MAG: sensor histidine kinase [Calothrix sp. C42_A2020_038]|nr:sensor histidine kinase [Calothrix sp. C42_A2020_038]